MSSITMIPKFVVIVNCQGQPTYYFCTTLIGAIIEFIKQYNTKKKYNTMRFSLEEVCICDNSYKEWLKNKEEDK